MSALLDSSVVIDCLRKQAKATAYFRSLGAKPAISVVSITEVGAGARTQDEQKDNAKFWHALNVYPVSQDIAERAGVLIRLYGKSHAVELGDALIAATAEHYGLPLATLNIKHFPMFAKLRAPY